MQKLAIVAMRSLTAGKTLAQALAECNDLNQDICFSTREKTATLLYNTLGSRWRGLVDSRRDIPDSMLAEFCYAVCQGFSTAYYSGRRISSDNPTVSRLCYFDSTALKTVAGLPILEGTATITIFFKGAGGYTFFARSKEQHHILILDMIQRSLNLRAIFYKISVPTLLKKFYKYTALGLELELSEETKSNPDLLISKIADLMMTVIYEDKITLYKFKLIDVEGTTLASLKLDRAIIREPPRYIVPNVDKFGEDTYDKFKRSDLYGPMYRDYLDSLQMGQGTLMRVDLANLKVKRPGHMRLEYPLEFNLPGLAPADGERMILVTYPDIYNGKPQLLCAQIGLFGLARFESEFMADGIWKGLHFDRNNSQEKPFEFILDSDQEKSYRKITHQHELRSVVALWMAKMMDNNQSILNFKIAEVGVEKAIYPITISICYFEDS